MLKFFVSGALSILLIGCGNSDNSNTNTNTNPKPKKPKTEIQTMSAKFSSMNKCLDSIEKASKGPLTIVTDKPRNVSGLLSTNNKLGFACEVTETGTEGTYVRGWYMVEEEVY